jgi:exodeoxyribonuclease V beta subunit
MSAMLDPLTLPLWGSRLIEASAGTGKTWTIAALYLRLVLGHGDDETGFGRPLAPAGILVMTFTKAATRELSERIRERLVTAAAVFRGEHEVDDDFLRCLLDAHPDDASRAQAAWRLAVAAESMDDAAVFTIDAWIQRMLREHAFDSGSLFDEELQPDEASLLAEAVRDYWRQEIYPLRDAALDDALAIWPDLNRLTEDVRTLMRWFDADEDEGRSLHAIWSAVSEGRNAEVQSLKAGWVARVEAMRDWLTLQLSKKPGPFDGHKMSGKRSGDWLDRIARWAASPDQNELVLTHTAVSRLSPQGVEDSLKAGQSVIVPAVFGDLRVLVDALSAIEPPAYAMRRHAARRVATRLRALKRRAGLFGFHDLLVRLDRALHGPSGERLRMRIVEQYPVAMIDEFQDTSPLQYRIFDRLYRTTDNDRASALLLIGDPKQSIYAFRDADIQSYLRARAATRGRHYPLATNYRSTRGVVAAINRLFGMAETRGEGAFRFGARLGDEDASALPFIAVEAKGRPETLRDAQGAVAGLTIAHDAELSNKDDAIRRFAGHCAERIARTLNDEACGFVEANGGFMRLRPADIAILVRDRHEAAAMRSALQHRHVPSVFLSDRESVFASSEAADLMLWLAAVASPLDARRARVAFATDLVGLSVTELAQLSDDDRAFEQRIDQLERLNLEWRRQGILAMLRRALHLLDLPARWLAGIDGERRLTNVLHLAELMQSASAKLDGEQSLIRWLAEQIKHASGDAEDQVVRLESDADLVQIVTIHAAKGLEYPVVYVPFVCNVREYRWNANDVAPLFDEDGARTIAFRLTDEAKRRVELEAQQEDLRLLYVALTRARHALWVGVAPLRMGNSPACVFERSAFGYLLTAGQAIEAQDIGPLLARSFAGMSSVRLEALDGPAQRTLLHRADTQPPLRDAPVYAATFERDWSIGSFSALVRDLARLPLAAMMVDPAVEEEVLSGPTEPEVAITSTAARHRFPRGALAGNFLHDQLEWLAEQRFALAHDETIRRQLALRSQRQGWAYRAGDVVTWLSEVVGTTLPPIGVSLDQLPRILPEMEFWFPSESLDAARIDFVCRTHLLDGRERPPLPERSLRGLLMGFADLVFEVDGRYWVLDYKSNALGAHDADYTHEALERSMAEHRYDVQGAIYLLALHRLLRQRLGDRYDPERQLGGALYLFMRGIEGPVSGCYVLSAHAALLDDLDAALVGDVETAA